MELVEIEAIVILSVGLGLAGAGALLSMVSSVSYGSREAAHASRGFVRPYETEGNSIDRSAPAEPTKWIRSDLDEFHNVRPID